MKEKYPFEPDWPVEGFPMDESDFVQIRIHPDSAIKPPQKDYPQKNRYEKVYEWYEVFLCFRPSGKNETTDDRAKYLETYNRKSGRKVKSRSAKQCIARFKTEEEAKFFVHKLYQSKKEGVFFDDFPNQVPQQDDDESADMENGTTDI